MSEDVRWLWVELCGDVPDDVDDAYLPRPQFRRYCHRCGQVVHVHEAEGEVAVPWHLITKDGENMTTCAASKSVRVLEAAP